MLSEMIFGVYFNSLVQLYSIRHIKHDAVDIWLMIIHEG